MAIGDSKKIGITKANVMALQVAMVKYRCTMLLFIKS